MRPSLWGGGVSEPHSGGVIRRERERARQLVAHDRQALVDPHPGLGQQLVGVRAERELHGDLRRALGLGARAADVGDDAVGLAVEHGIDDVPDRAEVGGLDLHHVGRGGGVEGADVVDACWPTRRRRSRRGRRGARATRPCRRSAPRASPRRTGARCAARTARATSTSSRITRSASSPEQAVDVEVQDRRVGLAGAQVQHAVAHPAHVRDELAREVGRVDQAVRERVDLLEDHLVDVGAALLARLRVDRDGPEGVGQPPLGPDDLGHRRPGRCAAASSSACESP